MVWLPYGYGKVYVKRQRGHALQSMLDSSANALVRCILGESTTGRERAERHLDPSSEKLAC